MNRHTLYAILLILALILAMAFGLNQPPQKCRVTKAGGRSFVTACHNAPSGDLYEVEVLD